MYPFLPKKRKSQKTAILWQPSGFLTPLTGLKLFDYYEVLMKMFPETKNPAIEQGFPCVEGTLI